MGMKDADWITHPGGCEAPVFRQSFTVDNGWREAIADVCGLGWYELHVNGVRAGDAVFAPAVTTYEKLNGRRLLYPLQDEFTPHVHYCRHNITKLLRPGNNTVAILVGNGWYNQTRRDVEGDFAHGKPKLAFSIRITGRGGSVSYIKSGTHAKAGESHIVANNLFYGEVQELARLNGFLEAGFDDSGWPHAVPVTAPGGRLTRQTCPPDIIARTITPRRIGTTGGAALYDMGENTSGWVRFDAPSRRGRVMVEHSENIAEDGSLDFRSCGGDRQVQRDEYILDGRPHAGLHPHFAWHAFRYFTIKGGAENIVCDVVHTDVKPSASFRCGNEVLNGLFDMYVRTQLANLHGAVPSDCPHRERLGYTGDGQVTCETVMELFDSRSLYLKWVRDIFDCQCRRTGHVQHTAPFGGGGGGPGGWGGAAVLVPWAFWRRWGDASLFAKNATRIMRWFDYMETRTSDGLVTHEEEGGWCLGDWCVPGVESIAAVLPEPFVNTYFLIRLYGYAAEVFAAMGERGSATLCRRRARQHKATFAAAYFNGETGDFAAGGCGANAFGLDIGLGDGRTLERLVAHYRNLRAFDTGIFGTEIVTRVLCERGFADVAFAMMASGAEGRSFGWMQKCGATTLWENWEGDGGSHNHPMFGGCVKLLTQYFLGVRRTLAGDCAYLIEPADIPELGDMDGHITTSSGRLAVAIRRSGNSVAIHVEIPAGVKATLRFRGHVSKLASGTSWVDEFA